MRLWSINPMYLDRQGLCGLWKESLQAQTVLLKGEYSSCNLCNGNGRYQHIEFNMIPCQKCKGSGKIKTPYFNHSQLIRFKANTDLSLYWIAAYLYIVYDEGIKRGYKFDKNKIRLARQSTPCMTVTKGQLVYEFKHLQNKLAKRNINKQIENSALIGLNRPIQSHPLFKVIDGDVESWEKIK